MKLEGKESPSFSLFNPSESCLPTEERTQFRSRANDVFASLSRDQVAPSESSSAMLPPPPPPSRSTSAQINIGPSPELYASLVSDKAPPEPPAKNSSHPLNIEPKRGFGSNKRCFRAQHEITPSKFTKYTLQETDLTNDKQNKTAALSFLNDLKDNQESDETEFQTTDKKITFTKRKRSTSENEEDSSIRLAPQFNNAPHKNAVVMEEYVVGQTKSSSKLGSRQKAAPCPKSLGGKNKVTGPACYMEDEEEEED